MREIKFRLWCNNKKEWEKDAWHLTPNGRIVDTYRQIEMRKETHFLNQYTGLLDKNGVEIYESDIIKTDNGSLFEVVFRDGAFNAKILNKNKVMCNVAVMVRNKDMRVVGNIYQNPELLENT